MEEETAIKRIQKFQSGTIYVLISKEARQKLGLKRRDKMLELVDPVNKRLIYKRVNDGFPSP